MSQFVRDFYNNNAEQEWMRFEKSLCKIEFARTLKLIEKYFPKKGRVCDIGCGPGRYSIELIKRGYRVTLIDISDIEIRLAKERIIKARLSAEKVCIGDARNLDDLPSGYYSAALLLGPMYHIVEKEGRETALLELERVLQPGGVAIVAYLNSWGIMKTGIVDMPRWYRDIGTLREMLSEHVFLGQRLSGFTEAYWSTPEIALEEIKKAGLRIVSYAGAEGFVGGMGPLVERLAVEDPKAFSNVLKVAADTCEMEQFRDTTDHLHIVVRKEK